MAQPDLKHSWLSHINNEEFCPLVRGVSSMDSLTPFENNK